MDNSAILDKSAFFATNPVGADKSGIPVISAEYGQNYASRDICEEECDCLESALTGKPDELDESDEWSEEDEREFEEILRRARESHVSGF